MADGRKRGARPAGALGGAGGPRIPLYQRRRGWVQALATLLCNPNLANLAAGRLVRGPTKQLCVPGLNCHSCPAAALACPVGAFQAAAGARQFSLSAYVLGFASLLGLFWGRFICGFLCPFGWLQELLHRLPGRKISTRRLRPLRYGKYLLLLFAVWLLPAFLTGAGGMGDPYFCKYVCPQGILEAAIPLSLVDQGIRNALGGLFAFKGLILLLVAGLSILCYRPFCKWLCPLGAFYGLCNRFAFYRIHWQEESCTQCGRCARVCRMDIDIRRGDGQAECIRCGDCVRACAPGALRMGLFTGKKERKKANHKREEQSTNEKKDRAVLSGRTLSDAAAERLQKGGGGDDADGGDAAPRERGAG